MNLLSLIWLQAHLKIRINAEVAQKQRLFPRPKIQKKLTIERIQRLL